MLIRRGAVLVLLATCLTACGTDDASTDDATGDTTGDATDRSSSSASASPTQEPTTSEPSSSATEAPPPAKRGTELVVSDSDFGPMLFDARGQAIYLFDVETSSTPQCYGACADAWPPVLTAGAAVAGDGVDPGMLATTERKDGTRQLTYGGHPLYYYAHEGTGEVKCHDVFLNGGNWYVVQPDGTAAPPG